MRPGFVPLAWEILLEGDPKRFPPSTARPAWTICSCRGAEPFDRARCRMSRTRIGAIPSASSTSIAAVRRASLPIFAWVAIDILLWGFITRYLNSVSRAGLNFVPALLGAVLLWDFFTRVMQGVTMAFFEDVWTRNFLNFFATPLRTPEYLGGLIVTAIATSALSLVAMLAFARLAFGLSFFAYGLALAPFLAVLFLFGIALGVAAAALVLRLGPASEWLIWPIPMIVSPFAGVFYPITVLPGLDAGDRLCFAALLRLRGHARGRRRPAGAMGSSGARRGAGRDLSPSRLPLLPRRLPDRDPHRPRRPLQRRDSELTWPMEI